jgi:hypothetical protein
MRRMMRSWSWKRMKKTKRNNDSMHFWEIY